MITNIELNRTVMIFQIVDNFNFNFNFNSSRSSNIEKPPIDFNYNNKFASFRIEKIEIIYF